MKVNTCLIQPYHDMQEGEKIVCGNMHMVRYDEVQGHEPKFFNSQVYRQLQLVMRLINVWEYNFYNFNKFTLQ